MGDIMKYVGKRIAITLNDGTEWEYLGDAFTVEINSFEVNIWRASEMFNVFSSRLVKSVIVDRAR